MSELRILAGTAKGRALVIPASARPTPARIRKSLFDMLDHRHNQAESFLDLCAGAGGVGLEAASRGYVVTMIESNPAAVKALQKNANTLQLSTTVVRQDALVFAVKTKTAFDIVFYDPPYEQNIAAHTQTLLQQTQVLSEAGLLIVQTPVQLQLLPAQGHNFERRVYGSNALVFYQK